MITLKVLDSALSDEQLISIIQDETVDICILYTENESRLRDYPRTDVYNLVPLFVPERSGLLIEPKIVRYINKEIRSIPSITYTHYGEVKSTQAAQPQFKNKINEEEAIRYIAFVTKALLDYTVLSDTNVIKLIDELPTSKEIINLKQNILNAMSGGFKNGIYSTNRNTKITLMESEIDVQPCSEVSK